MQAVTRVTQHTAPAEPVRVLPRLRVVERVKADHAADNWLIAILVACACLFLVGMATYVLFPAITNVVGSSASTWSPAP